MTRCRGYRDAVGDKVDIHHGDEAAIQGVTGEKIIIYNVLDGWCLLIYQHNCTRVQNDRARHDEYLDIKLRAAANQAILGPIVIFHWVVRRLSELVYLILLQNRCRVFKREEWSVSLYACIFVFLN